MLNVLTFFEPNSSWQKLGPDILSEWNLHPKRDIRFDAQSNSLFWAIYRSRSSQQGNFAVCVRTLEFMMHHYRARNVEHAYIGLRGNMEEPRFLVVRTAREVYDEFYPLQPRQGPGGSLYWWANEFLRPVDRTPVASMLTDPPQWLRRRR